MRKIASIKRIDSIDPIKKADSIEVATVGGWKAVIGKDQYKVGELIIYCEIDSYLPIREEFEFLRKSSYYKMKDGTEGFRLKTMKLRGQLSQGLILNLDILEDTNVEIGTDVSELLNITKFVKSIPKELEGRIKGYIDSNIKKTGEERVQNLDYEELKKYKYYESEKLDGESFTSYTFKGEFNICTREVNLIIPEHYSDDLPKHLRYSLKHNLQSKIEKYNTNIAFQGELIGPGIIKNKYNLPELEFRLFNVFDIDSYTYYNTDELQKIADLIGVKVCPVINKEFTLPDTIEELLKHVEGKSILNKNTEREGSVFVSIDAEERISFKVISNKYLLKGGE